MNIINTKKIPLLLNGIGGIGKTEICKKILRTKTDNFKYVAWITYTENIKKSFVEQFNFEILNINEHQNIDDSFNEILKRLYSFGTEMLLIIDNFDNINDANIYDILKLPSHTLITSRLKSDKIQTYDIQLLSNKYCKELFFKYYKITNDNNNSLLDKIIELCGYHTLAIEVLAKTSYISRWDIKTIYNNLINLGFNLNSVIKKGVTSNWSDNKEVLKLFDHIRKLFNLSNITDNEKKVLINMSILPSIAINIDELLELNDELQEDSIQSLINKGWLKQEEFYILMHPLIKELVNNDLSHNFNIIEKLVLNIKDKLTIFQDTENNENKKRYISYASSILNYIYEKNIGYATLANNVSILYQEIGELQEALRYQELDISIRRKTAFSRHDISISYNNLATLYNELGDYNKAIETHLKVIKVFNELKAYNELTYTYHNISVAYSKIKDYTNAYKYASMSLELKLKLNCKPESLINTYITLSEIFRYQNEFDKAFENINLAKDLISKLENKEHPVITEVYNSLSILYRKTNNYDKALTYQMKAIELRKTLLGHNHYYLANNYHNICIIYADMKNYKLALDYADKAIKIYTELTLDNHIFLSIVYETISDIYDASNDSTNCIKYLNLAIQIAEKNSTNHNSRLQRLKTKLYNIQNPNIISQPSIIISKALLNYISSTMK